MSKNKSMSKDIKVLDLFCGIGGFSYGFIKTGYQVLGVDMWDICLQSHIPGGETMQANISKLQKKHLPTDFQNPDIIIGSPPCQTFSTVNIDTRTKDDSLIKRFMYIVNKLKPRFWIWENVMGSRCVTKGVTLDAQNFGVAQRRRRNFVSNVDISDIIMNKYHKEKKTVRQVLPIMHGSGILDGYNATIYSLDTVAPTIRRIPLKWYDGRFGDNVPTKKMRFTGFEQLSLKDHLTLMGFNRSMKLFGNKTQRMIQIGNCVSPAISLALSKRLLELC